MTRRPACQERHATRHLFGRFDANLSNLVVAHDILSALRQCILGVDDVIVLFNHEVNADFRRALLAGFGEAPGEGGGALDAEDALFVVLVHPAFGKHLSSWNMGLHRVVDLLGWVRTQTFDWAVVRTMLAENGVRAAAWATLRWLQLLAGDYAPPDLRQMLSDLQPGRMKRSWIDAWLRNDLPGRTSTQRWMRLLGFSMFLHDAPSDVIRAASGRRHARDRTEADLAAFRDLNCNPNP